MPKLRELRLGRPGRQCEPTFPQHSNLILNILSIDVCSRVHFWVSVFSGFLLIVLYPEGSNGSGVES